MFMVDTSVWIDYFNSNHTTQTEILRDRLGNELVIIGDLILTETLQGFRSDKDFREAKDLIRDFPVVAMLGQDNAYRAIDHYRQLRKKGITVRKTADVIIGTYCIVESIPLLYSDRDFDPMVDHLGLERVSPIS